MKSRIFFATFTAANLGLILYGILALVKPGMLLEPFLTHVYQFPVEAAGAITYLSALYMLLGYFNIFPGVLGLLFLYRYRTTGQEWLLKIVTASTILAYIAPIIFDNTVGTIGLFEIIEHILFALMLALSYIMLRHHKVVGYQSAFPSGLETSSPKTLVPDQLTKYHSGEPVENQKTRSSSVISRLGATSIGVWAIKHLVSPLQKRIYRASKGKILSSVGTDRNVLLLTTKGRRTGKDRTIPVFYLRYGEAIVICNVRPEAERTNPWVINLHNHPVAQLQIGEDIARYQAREATEDEINWLWPQLVRLWPAFQVHFEHGGHRSIFILERDQVLPGR